MQAWGSIGVELLIRADFVTCPEAMFGEVI